VRLQLAEQVFAIASLPEKDSQRACFILINSVFWRFLAAFGDFQYFV